MVRKAPRRDSSNRIMPIGRGANSSASFGECTCLVYSCRFPACKWTGHCEASLRCFRFAGYIDTAPGSVVANQGGAAPIRCTELTPRTGFIKQFGTVVENGKLSLDADYVSYWGVAQQVSTIFPQVLTAIATDRYGRRLGNWLYLGFACITIILEMVARNWQTWLVARLFAGITFGFIQAGPLTLMSEIVMPQMRGNVVGIGDVACPS